MSGTSEPTEQDDEFSELSELRNEWEFEDDDISPVAVVIGRLAFGPFILTRPCDPAGNCIGWRIALPAFVGSVAYALALATIAFQLGVL